jgi:uncharacterized DUF497 family protein
MDTILIWDLDDDPDGNVQHIAEHGLTKDEVASVFADPTHWTTESESTGRPLTFGTTNTGRYIAVIWEHVDDDPLTIYPITAYEPTDDAS